MDVVDYLRVLRRRWPVIAAAGLVALLVGLVTMPSANGASSLLTAPKVTSYTATTTLLETSQSTGIPVTAWDNFIKHGSVPNAAAKELGYKGDPTLLAQQVTARQSEKDPTIVITAVDDDPTFAPRIADAFTSELLDFLRNREQADIKHKVDALSEVLDRYRKQRAAITGTSPVDVAQQQAFDSASNQIQQQITTLQVQSAMAGLDLEILQGAEGTVSAAGTDKPTVVDAGPTNRWLRLALIVGVGLLLGAALALGIERFDTRLRGRKAFEDSLRVPVVASVPVMTHPRRDRHAVLAAEQPLGGVAEAYRSLRSSLMLLPSRPVPVDPAAAFLAAGSLLPEAGKAVTAPKVVLVVSARAREGKTTSLMNLAATLGEAGRRVIVLDCDFRNPEAHAFLDVPEGQGLSDLLAADKSVPLVKVLQRTNIPNVRLALAGTSTAHPGALLGLMGRYVSQAREIADVVLIDAPPVLLANDAIDLMPFTDTVVIVGRDGRTTRADAHRVAALLARLRVPCLGTILVASSDVSAAYFGRSEVTRRRWNSHAHPHEPGPAEGRHAGASVDLTAHDVIESTSDTGEQGP